MNNQINNRSEADNRKILRVRSGALIFTGVLLSVWLASMTIVSMPRPVFVSIGLLCAFILIVWYDLDDYRIPNWINYPLLCVGLVLPFILKETVTPLESLCGAFIGYGLIWGINTWWRQSRGIDGIGMGDAKLLAATGAWLGAFALPFVLLIASGSALMIILIAALITGRSFDGSARVPFGPFIALGFWSVWLISPL